MIIFKIKIQSTKKDIVKSKFVFNINILPFQLFLIYIPFKTEFHTNKKSKPLNKNFNTLQHNQRQFVTQNHT